MGYKYFKDSEIKGLNHDHVSKLDKARGFAGIPFKITSGFRLPEKNESVGGVRDSAHLAGLATDIASVDSKTRFKIVKALLDAGFRRIGIYKRHIHCDSDKRKLQDVMW